MIKIAIVCAALAAFVALVPLGAADGGGSASAAGIPATCSGGGVFAGHVPGETGGWGTFASCGGTIEQIVTSTGCGLHDDGLVIFHNVGGGFLAYVPASSVGEVNRAFLDHFGGGEYPIGPGPIFLARC